MEKIIAVASGKGGVGKTNVSLNLAIALSKAGRKVCLMDADLGLANINILLGAQPRLTFYHLLYEGASLDEVMFDGPSGVRIIPGVSGIQELTHVDESIYAPLMYQFHELDGFDFMIVDTAAGIAPSNVAFSRAADAVIVVLTPEPTSMTDGFALIKILVNSQYAGDVRMLPNMFESEKLAEKSMRRIDEAGKKFLNRGLAHLPPLLRDKSVETAVVRQKPFMEMAPGSAAAKCMRSIARTVAEWNSGDDTVRSANFIRDVIRYASDQSLAEMAEKYSATLEKRKKEKEAQASPPAPAERREEAAAAPSPAAVDGTALAALVETQKQIAGVFEKNVLIQEKMIEALAELTKNVLVTEGNGSRPAPGADKAGGPAGKAETKSVSVNMLDIDDFIKSRQGGGG